MSLHWTPRCRRCHQWLVVEVDEEGDKRDATRARPGVCIGYLTCPHCHRRGKAIDINGPSGTTLHLAIGHVLTQIMEVEQAVGGAG